jgi:predicted nucleic acid-binding protein
VLPQNIAEFYAAVTNPKRVSVPKPPTDALAAIDEFLALPGLTLLPVASDVVDRLLALLCRRPVTGLKVYDLHLIVAMLGNGITRICTFNVQDFQPFDELQVIQP